MNAVSHRLPKRHLGTHIHATAFINFLTICLKVNRQWNNRNHRFGTVYGDTDLMNIYPALWFDFMCICSRKYDSGCKFHKAYNSLRMHLISVRVGKNQWQSQNSWPHVVYFCIGLNFTAQFVSNKVSFVTLQGLLKGRFIMYPAYSDYGAIMADWKTGHAFLSLACASWNSFVCFYIYSGVWPCDFFY